MNTPEQAQEKQLSDEIWQAEEDEAVEEADEESMPGSDPPAHQIDDEPIPTAEQLEEEEKEKESKK